MGEVVPFPQASAADVTHDLTIKVTHICDPDEGEFMVCTPSITVREEVRDEIAIQIFTILGVDEVLPAISPSGLCIYKLAGATWEDVEPYVIELFVRGLFDVCSHNRAVIRGARYAPAEILRV